MSEPQLTYEIAVLPACSWCGYSDCEGCDPFALEPEAELDETPEYDKALAECDWDKAARLAGWFFAPDAAHGFGPRAGKGYGGGE